MSLSLRNTLQRIVAWQKTPIAPPEQKNDIVVCKNCGRTFASNYCPRCGQSANTPRLGSRAAIRIFLDTWGLGTYGFLRTLWNLFARPGYMIGDYIDGRRQPYFPPFKTLFVVGAAFAIVFALGNGFSEEAKEARHQTVVDLNRGVNDAAGDAVVASKTGEDADFESRLNEQVKEDLLAFNAYFEKYQQWRDQNRVTDQLMTYIFFAFMAWMVFRKAPRRPKMNLAESIIAHVYICAQMGTAGILTMLVTMPFVSFTEGAVPMSLVFLLFFYDYKQLYGYGIWGTLWRTILMHLLTFVIVLGLIMFTVGLIIGVHATLSA